MGKYVVYRSAWGYHITSQENYYAPIQDAHKTITFRDCDTMADAVLTAKTWLHLTDEQLIIIL